MNIAIIHNQYALKGGMERYLLDLAKGFYEDGDTVDVFVYRWDKHLPQPHCRVMRAPFVRMLPRRFHTPAFNAWLYRRLAKKIRSHHQLRKPLFTGLVGVWWKPPRLFSCAS